MIPEVQAASATASRVQRKVEPASLAVKAKVADVLVVEAGGFAVIVVSGGMVSGGGGLPSRVRIFSRRTNLKSWLPDEPGVVF